MAQTAARQGTTTPRGLVTTSPQNVILGRYDWPQNTSVPGAVGAARGLADPGERIDMDDDTPVLWDAVPAERLCGGCTTLRPVEAFSANRARRDGLNRYCRECGLAASRRARGVAEPFLRLRPSPDDRCAICDGDGGKRGLYLDHDHTDGRFRGWLCTGCNSAIGHLKDDPALLERAIAYLVISRPQRKVEG